MAETKITRADCVRSVLQRRAPERIVYAPNYWQWFTHQRHHGLLPEELRDCPAQLALMVSHPNMNKYDLSSLRFLQSATALLSPSLALEVEKNWGCRVVQKAVWESWHCLWNSSINTAPMLRSERNWRRSCVPLSRPKSKV